VGFDGFGDEGEDVTVLLTAGFDHAQQRRDEAAAAPASGYPALRAERQLSPDHRVTQRPFTGIVRRLDIAMIQKRPQRIEAIEDMPAHAGLFAAQPNCSLFEDCVHRSPQSADVPPHRFSFDRAIPVAESGLHSAEC